MPEPPSGLDLFGSVFACDCGRTHAVAPDRVLYAPDAAKRLPELLERHAPDRRIALVMDRRTRMVAGEEATDAFVDAGWETAVTIVPEGRDGEPPVCDDATFAQLRREVADADMYLAVGSGVLNDLAKWLAFVRDAPYAVLATAASMNGYASANVAPAVEGVKTLVRARPPVLAAADPVVIANAPAAMTAAGLGDILAKSVSSADWRMNHILFGDFYCARAVDLLADCEPLYLDHPEGVRDRDPEAIGALFEGLMLTGAAMTMAESSAPASGGEHLVSHTLDMTAMRDDAPHDLHGRQVGVGVVLASEVYRRVLAVEAPAPRVRRTGVDRAYWGALAPEVEKHYAEKIPRLERAAERLADGETWDRLRADLAPIVRPPERIRDCLARAGAAWRAADIGCSPGRLAEAFRHAPELRARFTVLDLADLLGVFTEQSAAEIAAAWTASGGCCGGGCCAMRDGDAEPDGEDADGAPPAAGDRP